MTLQEQAKNEPLGIIKEQVAIEGNYGNWSNVSKIVGTDVEGIINAIAARYAHKCVEPLVRENERLTEAGTGLNDTVENLLSEITRLKSDLEDSQKVITGLREENKRLTDWKDSATKVLSKWGRVADLIVRDKPIKEWLGRHTSEIVFEEVKNQQSEIDSLKEQLNNLHKSISRI